MGWWDIPAAVKVVGEVVRDVFGWATGGRTKGENALREEADHWHREYLAAMRTHDYQHANFALQQLRRVRDEARAQHTGT